MNKANKALSKENARLLVLTKTLNSLTKVKEELLEEENSSKTADKLMLRLADVEKEKSAIEQERDDNDEALVAANQKLQMLEKTREEEK